MSWPDASHDATAPELLLAVEVSDVRDLPEVRAALRQELDRPRWREILDDAALTTSELAANGLRHGEPPVCVVVVAVADRVDVTVADSGRANAPRVVSALAEVAPAMAEGGRGLWLAAHTASALALRQTAHGVVASATFLCGPRDQKPFAS